MRERWISKEFILHALCKAKRAVSTQTENRWRVTGPDSDGDDLTVIVAIEDGVLVVTVF
jgi:hypothetical protein